MRRIVVFFLLYTVCLGQVAHSQEPVIKVETELVIVPMSVQHKITHQAIDGLTENDFEIFDDDLPQQIRFFSAGKSPASRLILLDTSGSMQGEPMEYALKAARAIADDALPGDELAIMTFNEMRVLALKFGESYNEFPDVSPPQGKTALYDAILEGIDYISEHGSNIKKVIFLVSDGENSTPQDPGKMAARITKELAISDIQICSVIPSAATTARDKRVVRDSAIKTLRSIIEPTGGSVSIVSNGFEIEQTLKEISLITRNQYIIGFEPVCKLQKSGKPHTLKVRIKKDNATITSIRLKYIQP